MEFKVKIKSLKKIKETLDEMDECSGIFFAPEMKEYCGKEVYVVDCTHLTNKAIRLYKDRVKQSVSDYDYWYWHLDWVEKTQDTVDVIDMLDALLERDLTYYKG